MRVTCTDVVQITSVLFIDFRKNKKKNGLGYYKDVARGLQVIMAAVLP